MALSEGKLRDVGREMCIPLRGTPARASSRQPPCVSSLERVSGEGLRRPALLPIKFVRKLAVVSDTAMLHGVLRLLGSGDTISGRPLAASRSTEYT